MDPAQRSEQPPAEERSVLLVTHTGRADVIEFARKVTSRLRDAGFTVSAPASEASEIAVDLVEPLGHTAPELVMVLGGDGTFLRAAEFARPIGAPIVGVNLGRVGFLAETEPDELDQTVQHLVERTYQVEERMTLEVEVFDPRHPEIPHQSTWALNEASLEKSHRERILEVEINVDGHPLTSFGCDGILCATPTGSTAYAFSAGGPVVWPDVEAVLIVPNAAHALFARPLITAPSSVIMLDVADRGHDAVVCCDGRRSIPVPAGFRAVVRRGALPVRVARVQAESFSDRLRAKFHLPVEGFRNQQEIDRPDSQRI